MHFSTLSIALLLSLTTSTLASSPYQAHAHLHRPRHFNATASNPIAEQPTQDPSASSILAGASSAESATVPLSTGIGSPSEAAPSAPLGTDPAASNPLGAGSGAAPPFPVSTGVSSSPSSGFPVDPASNASSTVLTFTSGSSVITTTVLFTQTRTNVHTVTAPAGSGTAGAGGNQAAASDEPTTTTTSSSTTTETVTVIAQKTGAGSGSGSGSGAGGANNAAASSGASDCGEPVTVTETVKSTITVTAPSGEETGAGDSGLAQSSLVSPPEPIVTPSGAPFPAGNGTDAAATGGSSGFLTATKCSSVGLPEASEIAPNLKRGLKGKARRA